MSARLKTAIYLPNYGPFGDARIIADLARDAESAGWEGFFLWDISQNAMKLATRRHVPIPGWP